MKKKYLVPLPNSAQCLTPAHPYESVSMKSNMSISSRRSSVRSESDSSFEDTRQKAYSLFNQSTSLLFKTPLHIASEIVTLPTLPKSQVFNANLIYDAYLPQFYVKAEEWTYKDALEVNGEQ